MEHIRSDRRKAENHPSFPLIDSEGCQVLHDRRAEHEHEHERRKNRCGADIAGKILNILN